MPHLLIDRLRSNPLTWLQPHAAETEEDDENEEQEEQFGEHGQGLVSPKVQAKPRRSVVCTVLVDCLDILAGVIFVAGSICFLPEFAHEVENFLRGCVLFVIGGAIYVFISAFTSWEAARHCGIHSFETCENLLYLIGSIFFLVGTVLYWPDKAHTYGIQQLKSMSLGVYFNLFSPVFEGTVLFIIGSILFGFAAFVNSLHLHEHDPISRQLLTATTSCYMIGSILFVFGSVALLPTLGGTDQMEACGAWCFIIGSFFYGVGSCVSLLRTIRYSKDPENTAMVNSRPTAAVE